MERIELFNDHFQNFKVYGIPHAQLIIADPPYNLGKNAYASNPVWYKDGDNKNGESELAGKEFFDTDKDFRPAEFMHFCSQMLVKEPKTGITDEEAEQETIGQSGRKKSKAPCMVLFCAFEQLHYYIELGERYGFNHHRGWRQSRWRQQQQSAKRRTGGIKTHPLPIPAEGGE